MTDGSTYTWHYRLCSAYFQDKELHTALFSQYKFQSVLGFMKRWMDTFNDQRQNSFMAIDSFYFFPPIQIKGLIVVSPIGS